MTELRRMVREELEGGTPTGWIAQDIFHYANGARFEECLELLREVLKKRGSKMIDPVKVYEEQGSIFDEVRVRWEVYRLAVGNEGLRGWEPILVEVYVREGRVVGMRSPDLLEIDGKPVLPDWKLAERWVRGEVGAWWRR